MRIGIQMWQRGICPRARRHRREAEASASAVDLDYVEGSAPAMRASSGGREFEPYTVRSCLFRFFTDGGKF